MGRLNYTNVRGLSSSANPNEKAHTLIDSIKRIPPGTGSKSALRDPVIELDVTGRDLGEDGFQEVADALTRSLEYGGENGRVTQLEELCLKTNNLSTNCLSALACIIRLAAHDLRDLDISDNRFTIATNQDAEAWEDFLKSFAECRVLRRLDLSGNPLDPKVFEVLARVYNREPAIVLMQQGDAEETLHSQTSSRRGTLEQTESLVRRTRNLSLASASDSHPDDDHEGDMSAEESMVGHGIGHGWSTPLLVDGMVDRCYCQTQNLLRNTKDKLALLISLLDTFQLEAYDLYLI
ncbi:MAG: hypothetical protein Q9209_007225 [Squamulea sp. 1 TL-2023]